MDCQKGLARGATLRAARAEDALCLGVLGTQVFLDTYATAGIRPALAREVQASFSTAAFTAALARPDTALWVAEREGHLVGFTHVTLGTAHDHAPSDAPAELLRLYVQEPFTGCGVGRALLNQAEAAAVAGGADQLWLTPWVHNTRALAFYAACGYQDRGMTWFRFEGEAHENRLFSKVLAPGARPEPLT